MALILTEEQQLLKDSALGFFAEKSPIEALRTLRDTADETGFSTDLWQEMSEMGFTSLLISEEDGGSGFGYVGAGIVAESMARTLTASPFTSSCVIAASLLAATDQTSLLKVVGLGEKIVTFAIDEGAYHDPLATALKATENGDTWSLNGLKTFVADGHVADHIIVLARTSQKAGESEGLSLFLVDKSAAGMTVDRTIMADSRNWAKITFEGASATLIGEENKAMNIVGPVLDKACIILSAELLGVAQAAFDQTMAYIKERKQFGQIIGTYQGLQHRAAHLYSEIEVTRSAVLAALQAADADAPTLSVMASIAKARACKTAELATNEAIQMHGGMGMTDEFEVGFFIKRARAVQNQYGGYAYHNDRFAALSSY